MLLTVRITGLVKILNEVNILAEIRRTQTPITNPDLVHAMDAMKADRNARTETTFVNTLKAGRFLVPANIQTTQVAQTNADGTVELKDQPQVQFILFNNKEGDRFFPLFTDESEIQKWNDSQSHQRAAITFRDLCNFFQRPEGGQLAGAVINPYGQNIMIPVESLLRMQKTEAIAPGTKIQIGTLKEEPSELLEAIYPFIEESGQVEKAYLRVMKREDKPNPNFLLVLDVDVQALGNDGIKTLFDGIAEIAKPHLRGVELAIVPASNNFGAAALRDAEPFFDKKHDTKSVKKVVDGEETEIETTDYRLHQAYLEGKLTTAPPESD